MPFFLTYFEPISHNANGDWAYLPSCYNGLTANYGWVFIKDSPAVFNLISNCWGKTVKIYFNRYSGILGNVKVKLYHDGAWELVHSGAVTLKAYNVFSLAGDDAMIEAVSIETGTTLEVYPMQVHNIQVNTIYVSPDAYYDYTEIGWDDPQSAYDRDESSATSHIPVEANTRIIDFHAPANFVSDMQAIAIKVGEFNGAGLPWKLDIFDGDSTWTELHSGVFAPLNQRVIIPFDTISHSGGAKAKFSPLMDDWTGSLKIFEVYFMGEYSVPSPPESAGRSWHNLSDRPESLITAVL